jgi:mRNA interferase MazF
MRRGEIWWAAMDPARGSEIRKTRPAVILSVDQVNRARQTVVLVPLSTGPRARPPLVVAAPSVGPRSVAICDQLRALDKSRLSSRIGSLSSSDLQAVERGVRTVLGL